MSLSTSRAAPRRRISRVTLSCAPCCRRSPGALHEQELIEVSFHGRKPRRSTSLARMRMEPPSRTTRRPLRWTDACKDGLAIMYCAFPDGGAVNLIVVCAASAHCTKFRPRLCEHSTVAWALVSNHNFLWLRWSPPSEPCDVQRLPLADAVELGGGAGATTPSAAAAASEQVVRHSGAGQQTRRLSRPRRRPALAVGAVQGQAPASSTATCSRSRRGPRAHDRAGGRGRRPQPGDHV